MGKKRNTYGLLVGKPGKKRSLGRSRHRWVDHIEINVVEIGCDDMDCNGPAQDRDWWKTLVKEVMTFLVPYNSGNFLSGCITDALSRIAQLHEVSYLVICEVLCASVLVKSGLENQDYGRRGPAALIMRHPSILKSWH
jgi:hypothetical protein